MLQPGRKYTNGIAYRFGFNGKENDTETTGTSTYDYGFRIYNQALGRFLSVDPLTKDYAELTPFQFASNNPVHNIDIDGLEGTGYEQNLDRWIAELGKGKITEKQYEKRQQAVGLGLGAGLAVAATIYTGGRALPYVKQIGTGLILWGSRPENQQRIADGGMFVAELFNPEPTPLNPGNPGGQLGNEVKQVTKKLFTSLKPIITRRKELAKAWGIATDYINFGRGVSTQTLKGGETILYQYRIPGTEKGSYFVESLEITQEMVGLKSADYSEVYKVTLTQDAKVLKSTHKKDATYWRNKSQKTEGGGEQIYSAEIKKTAAFEKIEN